MNSLRLWVEEVRLLSLMGSGGRVGLGFEGISGEISVFASA